MAMTANTENLQTASETIRTSIGERLHGVAHLARGTDAEGHVQGLVDGSTQLWQNLHRASRIDKDFGPDGPHARHGVPEDRRALLREERRHEHEDAARTAAAVLPDAVIAAERSLFRATLPNGPTMAQREHLVRDELRMTLDAVDRDGGEVGLADAMLAAVEQDGYDSDTARILAGSWGRRYAAARRQDGAHEHLLRRLSEMAAQHGDEQQRRAATALQAFRQQQVRGALYNALDLAHHSLGLSMSASVRHRFMAG
jgi:hypothetical protein